MSPEKGKVTSIVLIMLSTHDEQGMRRPNLALPMACNGML